MDLQNATNRIAAQGELVTKIKNEVGKVIVGQEKLVDRLVLALVSDGHILRAGPREDPEREYAREGAGPRLQARLLHAGPPAG